MRLGLLAISLLSAACIVRPTPPPPVPRAGTELAPYFNRVAARVLGTWRPRQFLGDQPVAPSQNRYTELRVRLERDGRLCGITLVTPAGIAALDDAAIAAFHEAAPFPPPPLDLLDVSGRASFRFGFLYDPNGSPTQRWFTYKGD